MIHRKEISLKQLFCLVTMAQIGVSVLSLPYPVSRHSGHDAWMSLLLGGGIAQAAILVIYLLGKRWPDRPLPLYIHEIAGKPIGLLLNVVFAAYFLEASLVVVISYADIISRWVLFTTPWPVIVGLLVVLAAYIASSTLRSISVITQTIFLMFLICFALVCVSGLGAGDLRHFLPIGTHGLGAVLKDALPAFWTYAGYELLLYVFPYIKYRKPKDVLLTMSAANGFTTFFYVLVSAIGTYSFSDSQLNSIPEPLVFIQRQFDWPIVQSLDVLFMTIWLGIVLATVYIYLFMSARYLAFSAAKPIRSHSALVWLLSIVCFVGALWASDRQWMLRFSVYHNTATAVILVFVPLLLFLVALVRGKAAER